MKNYLWRIKLRSHPLWCHAPSSGAAMQEFIKQTGEPLDEYCLEWRKPTNLDGSELPESEYRHLMGLDNG
jgi:hypothetical protein